MKIQSVRYVLSAAAPSQFPKDRLAEVAFSGRSNVGKSSLLNRMVGRKIAKISQTPGKTRVINFFLVNEQLYFVDLPGYGYAKVSKAMQRGWQRLIEQYMEKRPNLKAVVVIIDARRERIPPADLQMIEYVLSLGIVCIPVFTKIDKLTRSERAALKRNGFAQLPARVEAHLFSALTGDGKKELLNTLAKYLA
ncbi:MAG: YihA family ribosome biogenesis GTP-binding protein [Candidatus Abyssobacteria bacterium SURF_5]|uniref:Probable GTP-binding protein EngB n=1 Tax=Abyssobacteria bacterium (strain SURF_5) TaxID=2093360 RepID=A0A3A4NDE2_ABYX5|nr:MAG: YihA family ribosome biogenesis GTP-binding protein [Candidatus Abyssubacteria bacterium SURF_5]